MEIQPQNTQPISDDQELAKVLAGVADEAEANDDPMALTNALNSMTPPPSPTLDPVAPMTPVPTPTATGNPAMDPITDDKSTPAIPAPAVPDPTPPPMTTPEPVVSTSAGGDLEQVKKGAITDLRPIMDKLSVEPDEMFDLYLLLIRSTDDKALIEPAYSAAKKITDEARRAQALLDVIKEIDYLSNKEK